MQVITYDDVKSKIIEIKHKIGIIDSDVAELYGVQTRDINKAVKNNLDKFPDGYILELDKLEKSELVENFHRFEKLKHSTVQPKIFTERGLYMLATILKSSQATQTTIAIIDAFTTLKELTHHLSQFTKTDSNEKRLAIADISSRLFIELMENELVVSQREAEFKIKLPFFEYSQKTTKVKK